MTRYLRIARASADHPMGWPKRVECAESPDLFYRTTRAGIYDAQQICARCPMLQRCAQWALTDPESSTDGVFASVPMPPIGSEHEDAREEAVAQLRLVAATGVPADEIDEQLLEQLVGTEFDDEIEEVA